MFNDDEIQRKCCSSFPKVKQEELKEDLLKYWVECEKCNQKTDCYETKFTAVLTWNNNMLVKKNAK